MIYIYILTIIVIIYTTKKQIMFSDRFIITKVNLSQPPPRSTSRLPRWSSGKQKNINRRRRGESTMPKFRDYMERHEWFDDREARLQWNAEDEYDRVYAFERRQEFFHNKREEDRVARATRDAKRNSVESRHLRPARNR